MSENIKEEVITEEIENNKECCNEEKCCEATKEESLEDVIVRLEEELRQNLGDWLYTEFNNRGLKIPSLKNAKF